MPEPRIVSLIPSATEIVCDLGLGHQLVGRSHSCDQPEVMHLPECTSVSIDVEASSRAIDEQVRAAGETSVYRINEATLASLRPDVILTQGVCDLCAAGPSLVEAAIRQFDPQPDVFAFCASRLAGVWEEIEEVAEHLGVAERGRELAADLRSRVATCFDDAADRPRQRLVFLDWIDPLMTAGHWIPDIVAAAGAEDVLSKAGSESRSFEWSELLAADPDVILIAPCGFSRQRAMGELGVLAEKPEWSKLRAVSDNQVFVADGQKFFNRPAPSLADSVEMLSAMLIGDESVAESWVRLDASVLFEEFS
ncbi:ABC transporter substrate-binding protein [Stratiformator vulcanicus]|uniref:Corrinoid ABC transporter substrate-binding protein n=1 Tax=Stratiformator vulcanicus TaxID=2527980 RepID=A0A517R3F3_9PLAN|nr:ABC transporter substrate-binding protein [Stratiformator vulcanicus]QDT38411.1 corrinoid ABC transporter substrate-binding protein [Stratiformator vulcanicus]